MFRGSHRYAGYLSTPQETVVFSRAINQVVLYPSLALTYDNPYSGVGAYTDVVEGMEIVVYSGNTSTIKGRLRVAAGGATATTIQINEVSANRIPMADNDRFEVLRSFRLRDKLVGASETFPKDSRVEYADQNSIVAPLVQSGGHYAGKLVDGSLAVAFTGSGSQAIDPDSSGALTHSWSAPGASPSTSTSANPTFTYSAAGTYWVEHTVIDSSNGRSARQRSVVRVHDESDAPVPVQIESLSAELTEGWSCTFRAFANSSITTLPDGAMVIYWEEERYDGTLASYGNRISSRSHIKFVGYLVGNSIRIDEETGELTFEAVSPLAVLRQLPGFSQALKAVTSPANWQEWRTPLRTNDLMVYLLRWHTTALELFDLTLPDYNYAYPEFFVQQQVPAGQVAEIADAVDASLRCDRTGTLIIRQALPLVGPSARASAVTTYDLQASDLLDIEIEYGHRYRVAQLTGRAFTSAGDPIQSLSGAAPTEGSDFTSADRLIVDAQTGSDRCLNERTGRRWARDNRLRNGKPAPTVTVTLRGGYDVFDPAYDEWVTLTLSGTVRGRDLSFAGDRFTLEGVEVSHEQEEDAFGTQIAYKRVRLTLIGETDGAAGITYVPPQEGGMGYFAPEEMIAPVDFGEWNFSIGGTPSRGTQTIAAFNQEGAVYICSPETGGGFDVPAAAGGPFWNQYYLGVSGFLVHFVVDAWSPKYVGGGSAVNGWVFTTTGIYRIADIFGARTVTLQHTLTNGVHGSGMWPAFNADFSFGVQNWGIAAWFSDGAGLVVARTTNGTTWTESVVGAMAATGAYALQPGLFLSSRIPGLAYITVPNNSTLNAGATGRVSTNYGATWATYTPGATRPNLDSNLSPAMTIEIPFDDNPNQSIAYYASVTVPETVGSAQYLYRSNGATRVNIAPTNSGGQSFAGRHHMSIRTSPINRQRLVVCGLKTDGGGNKNSLVAVSKNGGDTWVNLEELWGIPGYPIRAYTRAYMAGNDPNVIYLLGEQGRIGYVGDFATIDERSGNLTGGLSISQFVALCGG